MHRKGKPNPFHFDKIPYKTIIIATVFFVVGTFFLCWGVHELHSTGSIAESYEKMLLGMIMFIPGSYHTFMAIMACKGEEGYTYRELGTFEDDEFFHDDD